MGHFVVAYGKYMSIREKFKWHFSSSTIQPFKQDIFKVALSLRGYRSRTSG